MTHAPSSLAGELASLKARRDALRQAAGVPGARLRVTLDAALAELDAAIDALASSQEETAQAGGQSPEASQAERRLLRAVFQDAPVPLFLLERDGTVRRVNKAAGDLLETGTGYATGRPFTTFVNLPSRAAVHTQLASTVRTGNTTRVRCELLTPGGTVDCQLIAGLARLRGDADRVILAVSPLAPAGQPGKPSQPAPPGQRAERAGPGTASTAPGPSQQGERAGPGTANTALGPGQREPATLATLTRRLDLVMEITRLLLESASRSEAVVLQRCAELLASELRCWAIVDVARGQRLQREFVAGPDDRRAAELAREVAARDPQPGSVPVTVHDSGSSQLIAHADDTGILGEGPEGMPLLMLLGATSVLSVPLTDGENSYGALTLARRPEHGHFQMADLGLVEELGEQLALAIRLDRRARRRMETTDALRASLLPPGLPTVPGVEIVAGHLSAARLAAGSFELGGDFYDVYRTGAGWGLSIGDVGGRGEGVAALGAAARYAIRVLGYFGSDPAQVLTSANEIIAAEEPGSFVTACAVHLMWEGRSLKVTVGCAGHPGPVMIRKDGRTHQMRGGGVPLGLFRDTEPGIEEHCLVSGDVLVLFTDGLADAGSPETGRLGDRLTGELTALARRPPSQILARLQELAREYSHGQLRDDITIVALRVGEPPGHA
jgi:serine phosphatase RsbU (regulator of sigma subunit)/PAS domain-containing protein